MTTTKRTPRTRKPALRHATLGTTTSGKQVLWLTQGTDTRAYILTPIASAWGTAYTLGKADNGDGQMDTYCVLLDFERHYHTCDCAGHTFRNHCKHTEALLALTAAGKLPKPAPKQPAYTAADNDFDNP
jgi:hypothetical protein